MRIFEGTLTVKTVVGRNGPFNVAKLVTDIGDFVVKDKALEQFEAGTYQGRFTVTKLEIQSTRWKGGYFNELLARIADQGFNIFKEDELVPGDRTEEAQTDPDPMDTESGGSSIVPIVVPKTGANISDDEAAKNDALLFGSEHGLEDESSLLANVRARATVRLDTTIDRELFRKQRDRLKELGYRFNVKEQSWSIPQ